MQHSGNGKQGTGTSECTLRRGDASVSTWDAIARDGINRRQRRDLNLKAADPAKGPVVSEVNDPAKEDRAERIPEAMSVTQCHQLL